jgi:hypothetical protein
MLSQGLVKQGEEFLAHFQLLIRGHNPTPEVPRNQVKSGLVVMEG